MTAEARENPLAGEILADARRQAERKIASSKRTAEGIISSARRQTEEVEQEVLQAARKRLEHEQALILADIPHQKQVRTLRVKEEVIASLFEQTLQDLRSGRASTCWRCSSA